MCVTYQSLIESHADAAGVLGCAAGTPQHWTLDGVFSEQCRAVEEAVCSSIFGGLTVGATTGVVQYSQVTFAT